MAVISSTWTFELIVIWGKAKVNAPKRMIRHFTHLSACVCLILTVYSASRAQKPELVVQTGHSVKIESLAFSPDGMTLASSSHEDDTIRLWNISTGQELRTIEGGGGFNVAFTHDGKIIVSGSLEGISILEVSTGAKLRTIKAPVHSIAVSPDGRIIAGDNRLWDLSTGALLRTLKDSAHVMSVVFSPDGKLIATGSWEGALKLWDVSTGAELRSIDAGPHVTSIAFSPDAKTVASACGDGKVKLWDTLTGASLRDIESGGTVTPSVAFSPGGKLLATADWNNPVKLWDVSTGVALETLSGHTGPIAFSVEGRILASGSADSTAKLWNVSSSAELRVLSGQAESVRSAAFSTDGKTLASGSDDGTVRLWDIKTEAGLRIFKAHSRAINSLAYSPDGKILASASSDGSVKLWDVSTGAALRTLEASSNPPGPVELVVFSHDSKFLVTETMGVGPQLWEVASGTKLQSLSNGGYGYVAAFSPDDQTIVFSDAGAIRIWNVRTHTESQPLKIHPSGGLIESIAFSPDGKILASASVDRASNDRTVKLWNTSSFAELRTFEGPTIESLAFSRDGKILAGGGSDGILKLWDAAKGTELHSLSGHPYFINSIAFTPDDKHLISGSWNSMLTIWDVDSGQQLATLIGLDQDWLVVTPDGLFDGSPAAWKKILWRFNNNTFDYAPVEAFFNEFYYPGLLNDISAGKHPKAPSDISQKDRRQPQLELALANGQLQTKIERDLKLNIDVAELPPDKAHQGSSGAQDVRLFRNGSLVKVWPGDVLKGHEKARLEVTIPIVAGENELTAYAFNHDNIKSEDATLTVTGAASLKRKGALHIVAIGVSRYANREYNLSYTTDDATSFASQLKLEQEKLARYQSVEIQTLLNEKATKANILAELSRLGDSVQPEDAVVVYFSGHGKANGDRFYLVPHDLGYTGSRDELSAEGLQQILDHSISDLELEESFRDIDAGQMFMIIDACNSGQALENKDEPRRGPMNARGLAQFAYEKGMYILTASQNVEEAFVSEKLKHSYLTYALVEDGLKTNAADADHDGEVTLREWFNYAVARVPKLREETLQSKSLEEITPEVKTVRAQKSQTPRVFYRREADLNSFVVSRRFVNH